MQASIHKQAYRFVAIGLASNATAYVAYLALTSLDLRPTMAMTVTYVAVTAVSFIANRQWTFSHRGSITRAAIRQAWLYLIGYLINWSALVFFTEVMHLAHQLVQAAMIVFLACLFFIAQRYWVFPQRSRDGTGEHEMSNV